MIMPVFIQMPMPSSPYAAMQEGRGKLFRLDALLGESCRQKKYSKFCPRSVIVDSIVGRTLRLGGFVDLQICESMKLDLNNMCEWRVTFWTAHAASIRRQVQNAKQIDFQN